MGSPMEVSLMLTLADMASGGLNAFKNSVDGTVNSSMNGLEKLSGAFENLANKMAMHGAAMKGLGDEMMHFVEKPIAAFEELDTAMTNLKVSMLDSTGQVKGGFEQWKQEAYQIDSELPMTSAQVMDVASALKQTGVAANDILNGGWRAAADLSVVMKIDGEASGELIGKMREAFQLGGNQLKDAADIAQRGRFAFGIKPEEIMSSAAYSAPTTNAMRLTGVGNLKEIMALQGMNANIGLQGSAFGTNFADLQTMLAKGPQSLELAKRGMKGELKKQLDAAGIKFHFFDAKGNFLGIPNEVRQLQDAYNKMHAFGGDRLATEGMNAYFGTQGGRPALTIGQRGIQGYNDAMKKLDEQASLDQRIKETMGGFASKMTVLKSNITNALAVMAEPAIRWLEPYIDKLSAGIANLREWSEKHKELSKWIMIVGGGAAALLTTMGSLMLTGSLFMRVLAGPIGMLGKLAALGPVASRGLGFISGAFGKIGPVFRALGGFIMSPLSAFRALGSTFMWLGRLMLANPIGIIITAIAFAGVMVYKYWAVVKPFLIGTFQGLKSALAPVIGALREVWGVVRTAFAPLVSILRNVWNWFSKLFTPVNASANALKSATSAGRIFGQILGGAFKVAMFPLMGLLNLVKVMTPFLAGAFQGLKAALGPLGGALKEVWGGVKTAFAPLMPVLRSVWDWFSKLFVPVNASAGAIKSATSAGRIFGQILGGAIRVVMFPMMELIRIVTYVMNTIHEAFTGGLKGILKAVIKLSPVGLLWKIFTDALHSLGIDIPKKFTDLGARIIDGLVDGIAHAASKVWDVVKHIGSGIKDAFTGILGIHSPSRVFFGFGQNIGEGATLGILDRVRGAKEATGKFSAAALDGMASAAKRAATMIAGGHANASGSAGVNVHFAPTINVNGASGANVREQVQKGLAEGYAEFERNMQRFMRARNRTAF